MIEERQPERDFTEAFFNRVTLWWLIGMSVVWATVVTLLDVHSTGGTLIAVSAWILAALAIAVFVTARFIKEGESDEEIVEDVV